MDDTASAACATEVAGHHEDAFKQMRARVEGVEPRNIANSDVNGDAPNAARELDPSVVRALATRLFTEGAGALVQLLGEPIASVPTPLLFKYAKEAVQELFDKEREAITRSCGKMVTKDLALGILLGDALAIELLEEEASQIGKAAAVQLAAAKKSD